MNPALAHATITAENADLVVALEQHEAFTYGTEIRWTGGNCHGMHVALADGAFLFITDHDLEAALAMPAERSGWFVGYYADEDDWNDGDGNGPRVQIPDPSVHALVVACLALATHTTDTDPVTGNEIYVMAECPACGSGAWGGETLDALVANVLGCGCRR